MEPCKLHREMWLGLLEKLFDVAASNIMDMPINNEDT